MGPRARTLSLDKPGELIVVFGAARIRFLECGDLLLSHGDDLAAVVLAANHVPLRPGLDVAAEADPYTMQGLVNAIVSKT